MPLMVSNGTGRWVNGVTDTAARLALTPSDQRHSFDRRCRGRPVRLIEFQAMRTRPAKKHWPLIVAGTAAALLSVGACGTGGGSESTPTPTSVAPSTTTPPKTTTRTAAVPTSTTAPQAPAGLFAPADPTTYAPPATEAQIAPARADVYTPPPAPAHTPPPAPAPFVAPPAAPAPVAPKPPASSTYYANCAAVRAAGAAPLYAGSPGYSTKLDRDGDGVACEK
ncbi:hypothetical protein GCM10023094_28970 [Rhodococcus olei]|uniref:Excalibur calcium-binding domain-containing protein n=2 Tax=Rhodococcus olei TaxID=2161675 RepID=A0ABP8P320_9NOCA